MFVKHLKCFIFRNDYEKQRTKVSYQFTVVVVSNYLEFSGSEQLIQFIFLHFWKPKAWNQYNQMKTVPVAVALEDFDPVFCSPRDFWYHRHLLMLPSVSTAIVPSVLHGHMLCLNPSPSLISYLQSKPYEVIVLGPKIKIWYFYKYYINIASSFKDRSVTKKDIQLQLNCIPAV